MVVLLFVAGLVYLGNRKKWRGMRTTSSWLAKQLNYLRLLLAMIYCNPPPKPPQNNKALPIRWVKNHPLLTPLSHPGTYTAPPKPPQNNKALPIRWVKNYPLLTPHAYGQFQHYGRYISYNFYYLMSSVNTSAKIFHYHNIVVIRDSIHCEVESVSLHHLLDITH